MKNGFVSAPGDCNGDCDGKFDAGGVDWQSLAIVGYS